jgi:2-(1,2-epoxy-1,2-dihydrophenyl)acetyl-CoA isomerase
VSAAFVRYEERDDVAVITVDRAERRNAWSVPLYRELVAALEQANEAEDVGAIMLTSTGPVYSAGVDLKADPEPPDERGHRPTVGSLAMTPGHSWMQLMSRSKPVVAAVNGAAIGVGVTHLLAVDIRIAARSATFGFSFLKVGAMPELGCSALLPQLVGQGRAVDLCLRARTIDAAEAERIGLVTMVVEDAELPDAALGVASAIARLPRPQVRLTKGMFRDNAGGPEPNEVLRREGRAFVSFYKLRSQQAGALE